MWGHEIIENTNNRMRNGQWARMLLIAAKSNLDERISFRHCQVAKMLKRLSHLSPGSIELFRVCEPIVVPCDPAAFFIQLCRESYRVPFVALLYWHASQVLFHTLKRPLLLSNDTRSTPMLKRTNLIKILSVWGNCVPRIIGSCHSYVQLI